METKRVQQFCTVAETLNLRKASDLLNISHGGLFKSLKVLEEELGFPLFRKSGRAIVLTEKGQQFYHRAVKFLNAYEELITPEQKNTQPCRIGTFEVFSTYTLPVLEDSLSQSFYLIKELTPGPLERALLNHEVDIGITYEPIPMRGLNIINVAKFQMNIFGKPNQFSNMIFKDLPFAAPAIPVSSNITSVRGLDGWPDHKFHRNIKFYVDMMETALQLCSKGSALGFFPDFVIELYNKTTIKKNRLEKYSLPRGMSKVYRNAFIISRENSDDSETVSRLTKSLKNILTNMD